MAKDPYRYFRVEARELLDGLSQGILALEKGDAGPDLIARLLRLAHTLKGAARVVKQVEVAQLAHAIEEILAPRRDTGGAVPGAQVNQLLALVDTCGERLRSVFAPPEREGEPEPPGKPDEPGASLRVEVAEVDALLYELADAAAPGGLREQAAALDRIGDALDALVEALAGPSGGRRPSPDALHSLAAEARTALRVHGRSLGTAFERTRQDLDRVRDRVSDLRLLPAREIFAPPAHRATRRGAREAASPLKRPGANTASMPTFSWRSRRVRPSRSEQRRPRHRDRTGAGTGRASRARGGSNSGCSSGADGSTSSSKTTARGIDMAAIRASLIARRLATPEAAEALGMREAVQLLFQGGFSTAPAVSEVMGRGVGLDVVRATVARLKGDIDLRSEPGRGTTVEIAVPVSLESLDVLTVVAGGRALIPFDAVRRTLRLTESDLAHSATGTTLFWEGEAIPFRTLAELVGGERATRAKEWTAVVVRARGGSVAVGVDRLEGVRNAVVRPLPALAGPVPLIGKSATLDGGRRPATRTRPGRAGRRGSLADNGLARQCRWRRARCRSWSLTILSRLACWSRVFWKRPDTRLIWRFQRRRGWRRRAGTATPCSSWTWKCRE